MTQAFNLAQLANNLNTSGQLDATDGLNGLVANANLASSGSPSSSTYLRGDRTWASLPASGKILNVYQATNNTTYSISGSGTFTNMVITLTPASASSRFMLFANLGQISQVSGGSTISLSFSRNGASLTYITAGTYNGIGAFVNADSNAGLTSPPTIIFIDSPATTGSIIYRVIYECDGTKNVGRRGDTFISASQQFQIMEISS